MFSHDVANLLLGFTIEFSHEKKNSADISYKKDEGFVVVLE